MISLGMTQGVFSFENQTYEGLLAKKYKNCNLTKENIFLTSGQQSKISLQTNLKQTALLLRFKVICITEQSYVYVDSHIVRTLNETVVIEVKQGELIYLQIASFMEPKTFLPPQKWLDLFLSKNIILLMPLPEQLFLKMR